LEKSTSNIRTKKAESLILRVFALQSY